MGVRFPFAVSNTLVTGTIVTTTETVFISAPPITPSQDFAQILIEVGLQFTTGTATTSYLLRILRGTVAGTGIVLSSGNLADSLGILSSRLVMALDTPAAYGPVQYSCSIQQAAATGNGTVTSATIAVFAL